MNLAFNIKLVHSRVSVSVLEAAAWDAWIEKFVTNVYSPQSTIAVASIASDGFDYNRQLCCLCTTVSESDEICTDYILFTKMDYSTIWRLLVRHH